MATPVPPRNEPDSPGNRSSTLEGFLTLLRLHEKELYKAAWALCDSAEFIEHLLERTVLSIWNESSRAPLDQPFRRRLAGKLIEVARITRVNVSAPSGGNSVTAVQSPEFSSELSPRIHRAMRSLPWDCREAFVLRDLMGFTAEQCAEVLGISHAEARQLVSNARLCMTQELSAALSARALGGAL